MNMKQLHIENPKKPGRFEILEVLEMASHQGKGQYLATVEGITDRDEAESFTGWLVTIAPDERVSLPEGEFWIDSLIGLGVVDVDSGAPLGTVEDVMSTGSNDIYQVRTPEGTVKLVPAIEEIVREIDLESGTMKIFLMEGLWD